MKSYLYLGSDQSPAYFTPLTKCSDAIRDSGFVELSNCKNLYGKKLSLRRDPYTDPGGLAKGEYLNLSELRLYQCSNLIGKMTTKIYRSPESTTIDAYPPTNLISNLAVRGFTADW